MDDPARRIGPMAVTCTVTADGARAATVTTWPYFVCEQGGPTHGKRRTGLDDPPVTRVDVRFFEDLANPLPALRNGWSTDPKTSVFLREVANAQPP